MLWDSSRQPPRHVLNFWTVAAGRGRLTTPEGAFDLSAGDSFALRMWEPHLGETDPADPLTVLWATARPLDADGRLVGKSRFDDPGFFPRHRRLADLTFYIALFDRMLEAHMLGDQGRQEANRWLQTVVMEMRRSSEEPDDGNAQRYHANRMNALCRRIRNHPQAQWRVADLARELHFSRAHFARVFRRLQGMSPREFITRSRIQAACHMLEFSGQSVTQIAGDLGFCDVYHFSRQFKAETGMSPLAYRQRQRAQ